MPDMTATEAARRFSDLLDAVEHNGERFTITRHGRAIAQIEPTGRGRGSTAKELLRSTHPDQGWARDLTDVRDLLLAQERP